MNTETQDRINACITECTGVAKEELTPEAKLGDDLGLDSLDGLELILELESEFNISITDSKADAAKTVNDIYKIIEEAIQ